MTSNTQNTAPELCPFCASNVVVLTADGRGWCIRCGAEADEWNRRDLAKWSISLEDHEHRVSEAVAAALEEAIIRVNGCDRVSEVQPAIRALIEEKKA
jgi:predicted amidophosphoribosyltransferase